MKKNDLKSISIDELWALHAEPTTMLSARIDDEKLRLEKLSDKLRLISAWQRRPHPSRGRMQLGFIAFGEAEHKIRVRRDAGLKLASEYCCVTNTLQSR
jgi:hypothetical protein